MTVRLDERERQTVVSELYISFYFQSLIYYYLSLYFLNPVFKLVWVFFFFCSVFLFFSFFFHVIKTTIFRPATLSLPAFLSVDKDFRHNVCWQLCTFPFSQAAESYFVFICFCCVYRGMVWQKSRRRSRTSKQKLKQQHQYY